MGRDAILEHFDRQAYACERLGSPFTALLCRLLPGLLDTATSTGHRVWNWDGDPREDALALRLCGGLHALVLDGADPGLAETYPPNVADEATLGAVLAKTLRHQDRQLCGSLDQPPQTNEIARAAMLLPGLLTVARETGLPLDLYEIGSSAGLNLLFDRFHYRYEAMVWGDDASPVRLSPEVRGQVPPLGGQLEIASRCGSDIAPIDLATPDERLRLLSYLWPDQTERIERATAALMLATHHPVRVERADAAAFAAQALGERRAGHALVLLHSIMWQYLSDVERERIETLLATAGADGGPPLAWLRMEPLTYGPYATLRLTLWPDGMSRDLARCDFHGRWIEWMAG